MDPPGFLCKKTEENECIGEHQQGSAGTDQMSLMESQAQETAQNRQEDSFP